MRSTIFLGESGSAIRRLFVYGGVIGFVFVIWGAVSFYELVIPALLPAPINVLRDLSFILDSPSDALGPILATTKVMAIAIPLACTFGIPLGLMIGRSRLLMEALEPLISNFYAVPIIILYPMLAGLLGVGIAPKLLICFVASWFPITIAAIWTAHAMDTVLAVASRSMGASSFSIMRKVVLPAAVPGLLTGLRTATGLAFVTLLAAEFLASASGVGHELARYSQSFQNLRLFAWLLLILALGAALNGCFALVRLTTERCVYR